MMTKPNKRDAGFSALRGWTHYKCLPRTPKTPIQFKWNWPDVDKSIHIIYIAKQMKTEPYSTLHDLWWTEYCWWPSLPTMTLHSYRMHIVDMCCMKHVVCNVLHIKSVSWTMVSIHHNICCYKMMNCSWQNPLCSYIVIWWHGCIVYALIVHKTSNNSLSSFSGTKEKQNCRSVTPEENDLNTENVSHRLGDVYSH